MSKKILKKTREIYLDQHRTYFKHNELFNRFYQYAVKPKNYCLKKIFFKNITVLDAGCGNSGYFAKAMLDLGAKHVFCMDLGSKWIHELKIGLKKKRVNLSKITFISGSVTKIPFKSNFFDFVACNGVLYHLPNVKASTKALKELFRVTKIGGSTFVYLGYEKPGLIDKYILPSLRIAYQKEKQFKKIIDGGNIHFWRSNLINLAKKFIKNDSFTNLNSLKKIINLFNLETLMFMQDSLQVPKFLHVKLNKKYAFKIIRKIGGKNIRSPKDFYFKRTDIRRFLTPFHTTKKVNNLSKLLYGELLKFTFDKK